MHFLEGYVDLCREETISHVFISYVFIILSSFGEWKNRTLKWNGDESGVSLAWIPCNHLDAFLTIWQESPPATSTAQGN